jgi:hypothetical protein
MQDATAIKRLRKRITSEKRTMVLIKLCNVLTWFSIVVS